MRAHASSDGTESTRAARQSHPGGFVIQLIVDDLTASSLLRVSEPSERKSLVAVAPSGARRTVRALARGSRFKSLRELVTAPRHDIDWLRDALQTAVQFGALRPSLSYLTARWSIRSPADPVAQTIKQIAREEMFHMGLACNLLAAISGSPLIADAAVRPEVSWPVAVGYTPWPKRSPSGSSTRLRRRSSWRSNIRNMDQSPWPASRW